MPLPRFVPTRLLEAADREAKACFAQASLGLLADYQSNGEWKIFPFPLTGDDLVSPHQINIIVLPVEYEQGVGAVSNTELIVRFFFHFPTSVRTFVVGGNSYLDHICALRQWLFKGGTWAERIGRTLTSAPIEDPDSPGKALGTLAHFDWGDPFFMQNKSALVVAADARWDTREASTGELV